jgi:hypothetical protein
LRGGLNLYGFAGGDPVNFSDPFGLSGCEKKEGEEREKCEEEAKKAQEARVAACVADAKQAILSTATSVLAIGAYRYVRALGSLTTAPAAWNNPAVTNSAVANFSLLPPAAAMEVEFNRQGGTPNPFEGNAAVAYQFFSALPVVGPGLKLGEAINSCRAAATGGSQ